MNQPKPAPAGLETDLIGRTVKAVPLARAGRIMTGVVLPPAANARVPMLRLACPGRAPVRFDPDKYDVTTVIRDTYNFGNLPAEHLATKTMLKTEKRLQPADGQAPIAFYSVRDGVAPLYAVADAVPMPALSPARAAAWAASRTCVRCGTAKPRPLPDYTHGGRLCDACQAAVAVERWIEASRAAQAETAQWARDVLEDSSALLMVSDGNYDRPLIRIEPLHGLGEALFTGRLRSIEDLDAVAHDGEYWTSERIQEWRRKYDNTVPPSQWRKFASTFTQGMRIIGWSDRTTYLSLHSDLPGIARTDQVGDRLVLWSGIAPARYGSWYPKPKIPFDYTLNRYPLYAAQGHLGAENLAARISHLRTVLYVMASSLAPEPTVPTPAATA